MRSTTEDDDEDDEDDEDDDEEKFGGVGAAKRSIDMMKVYKYQCMKWVPRSYECML